MAGARIDRPSSYVLLQECDVHVQAQMTALQGAVSLDPVAYLDRVDGMWCDYCAQLLTIRQVYGCCSHIPA